MADNQKEPETYYVRMAKKAELDKVINFYKKNKHENICERNKEILENHVDDGSVVIIESAEGKIVAASISYAHTINENGIDNVKWIEVGSTRISGLNGFTGVFDIMTSTQILRSYLVEPPEECFVARMKYEAIQKTAERLGWRPLPNVPPSLEASSNKQKNLDNLTNSSDNWYSLRIEGMPTMAQHFINAMNKSVLTHRKTGENIKISFERSNVFNKFKTNIENLAKKNHGSIDNPDLSKGIRHNRDQWLKRYFR